MLPEDDSGRKLTPKDADFVGVTPQQVLWWKNREAPLGMTPKEYEEFRASMFAALEADGVSPDQVDIRLQGSSAHFYSGTHKQLWAEEDVAAVSDEYAAEKNIDRSKALNGLREWFGGDTDRPLRRPFDSHYTLGIDENPSDYDVQISSDVMVDRCRVVMKESDIPGSLMHPKYGFANKQAFGVAYPNVMKWADDQEQRFGREVAPALFRSSGPPNKEPSVSAHFRDTDWIMER